MRPVVVLLELGCSTPTPPPSFVYFLLPFWLLWGPQALLIIPPSFWCESLSRDLWVCGQHCVDLRNWAPPMCDSHPLNTCFKLGNGKKVKVHFLCLTCLRSPSGRSMTRARRLHLLHGLGYEADCQCWTLQCSVQDARAEHNELKMAPLFKVMSTAFLLQCPPPKIHWRVGFQLSILF